MINTHQRAGFTLVELMIVVAVIAILATIAVPSYQSAVRKSRRGQAKADLVAAAQAFERYHAANNSYTGATLGSLTQSPSTGTAHYTLAVSNQADETFTITATPTTTAGQNKDACGALAIDQTGAKTHSAGDDGSCSFGTVKP